METSILYVEKIYIHSLVFIFCDDKKSIPHPYNKKGPTEDRNKGVGGGELLERFTAHK